MNSSYTKQISKNNVEDLIITGLFALFCYESAEKEINFHLIKLEKTR